MSDLNIEICPETGICSIIKQGTGKVDLLADEISAIQRAGDDTDKIKVLISDCNKSFGEVLDQDELSQIAKKLA